ncbi:hypothetical protein DFH06DRAFT_1325152 [Mycena polygramma]|nr:hypothetical protein DFH06DRAFT_1325152 [Mycena polygramma]
MPSHRKQYIVGLGARKHATPRRTRRAAKAPTPALACVVQDLSTNLVHIGNVPEISYYVHDNAEGAGPRGIKCAAHSINLLMQNSGSS